MERDEECRLRAQELAEQAVRLTDCTVLRAPMAAYQLCAYERVHRRRRRHQDREIVTRLFAVRWVEAASDEAAVARVLAECSEIVARAHFATLWTRTGDAVWTTMSNGTHYSTSGPKLNAVPDPRCERPSSCDLEPA